MATTQINHVCILDRTNAAHHNKSELIEAYYDSLGHIRQIGDNAADQVHRITLITIQNHGIAIPVFNARLDDERLDRTIAPIASGPTPLYDCLAQTIGMLRVADRNSTRENSFRFTIFSNGRDTSSTKYSASTIKLLLDSLQSPKWNFTIIGCSNFTSTYAQQMGIRQVCVVNNQRKNSYLAMHLAHLLKQKHFQIQAA